MAKDGYVDTEEEFKYYDTKTLKQYASQSSTLSKRLNNVEGMTSYFFSRCLAITVVGSVLAGVVYMFMGSWIILLFSGILLFLPALSVCILGMVIVGDGYESKQEYNQIMAELARRSLSDGQKSQQ